MVLLKKDALERSPWRDEFESKGLAGNRGNHRRSRREGTPQPDGAQRLLLLVSRAPPRTTVAESMHSVPRDPAWAWAPEEKEGPSPEQEPSLSCWSYLVRLQLFPNGLDGVPTLAEHGFKQALLGLFTLSLNKGRMRH